MNCHEIRQHWELYYDSEGDSELYLRVNEHLAGCPACSKWFFRQASLEDALVAKLAAAPPTPELWQRVLSEVGVAEPVATRGWAFFSPFLALAATLLLAVGFWQFSGSSEPEHLSALTAAVHRELSSGAEPIEFASASDEEVESYLKQRVAFPVRCPPRKNAGFVVRGGGICAIAGDTAAYVRGRVDDGEVSIFILPEERLAQFVHERDALLRESVHHCREGDYNMVLAKVDRNIVVVIGHGRPEQLEKVVRAYGTYPEDPAVNGARSATKSPNLLAA
ncbi:MAG: zf-HC2 domain-containing protein [Pirellulales bacterium]